MSETSQVTQRHSSFWAFISKPLVVPALALFSAFLVGAILMLLSGDNPLQAYWGLLRGAFGDLGAVSRTLRRATPFILTGLAVAIGFKAGLFNIGASGQYLMGTICSVWVGLNFEGLPAFLHVFLALLAGMLGGAVWAAIAGFLRAWRGASEVITTIMLNYVASLFAGWTVYAGSTTGQQLSGPLSSPSAAALGISQSEEIFASARLPELLPNLLDRVHWGLIIALGMALLVWWIMKKTNLGFEIRTVGASPDAARYAGIHSARTIVLVMAMSGALAGLAGAVETLGLNFKYSPEFTGGVGFEGITIALLGGNSPFGIILSALLMGGLDAGAAKMQFDSGVASELIQVVQSLVLVFVAAPEIIRTIYRLHKPSVEEQLAETGRGGREA